MAILDDLTKSLVEIYASQLSAKEQDELIQALEIVANDEKYNKFKNMFPDDGQYRRELYPKHVRFFKAGSRYRERGFIAGNRTGKSEAGAFETTCHLTGIYPDWWEGKRFTRPILGWAGGDTAATCRDIIQNKLLGSIGDFGSGMIPKDLIVETKTRRNVPDAIETIRVKHITGGVSTLVLKTYDQGREAWQGAEVDWCWIDEECPQEVYGEALIRLMTTGGSAILTFTPLSGLTELVTNFLENSQETDAKYPKHITTVSWDDVPHISQEMKDEMLDATPPQLRDARSKGEPTVGSGRIYPVDIQKVAVDDFKIPKHWMKAFGMDVGWNNTAVVFGAWDKENDVIYVYSEHKQGESEPIIHAQAIKSRGEWLRGVIDPASRGRSQIDGNNLFQLYKKEGLNIYPADNAVEAGIYEVWQRLSTGRLKIFNSCTGLIKELNLYHRDDKGKIVKKNDHCLVGDTEILTPNGICVIKDLPETGYIFNKQGSVVKYERSRLIASDIKVIKVLSDKFTIEATPDHCFLGSDGLWYPALLLANKSLVNLEETCKKTLLDYQTNSKPFWDKLTGNVDSTFKDMERDFTGQFGNISMEKFQKDMLCIIEMVTELITIYQISNYCSSLSTALYTLKTTLPKELLEIFLKTVDVRQRSGMDHPEVKSGINSIITIIKTSYTEKWNVSALFVERFIQQLRLILKQAFATTTVSLLTGENYEKILRSVSAAFVEKNLNVIDILRPKPAVESVGTSLVKQLQWKEECEDVYCMDVPDGNSFVLANGVVSHNCLDALRYLMMSMNTTVWQYPSSPITRDKVVDFNQYLKACV